MNNQLSMFETARGVPGSHADLPLGDSAPRAPYAPDSDTSKEAAEYIQPHLQRMETLVLDAILAICKAGKRGATVFDVMDWLNLSKDNVAPRFTGLKDKGLIRKTERRLPRLDAETKAWAYEVIA